MPAGIHELAKHYDEIVQSASGIAYLAFLVVLVAVSVWKVRARRDALAYTQLTGSALLVILAILSAFVSRYLTTVVYNDAGNLQYITYAYHWPLVRASGVFLGALLFAISYAVEEIRLMWPEQPAPAAPGTAEA